MTEAIQRGSVVLRAGSYGFVWDVRAASLVLLPIERSRGGPSRAHDVDLEFTDLLTAAIALPDAQVRAGMPIEVPANDQVLTGQLKGRVLCMVVQAVSRAHAARVTEARWTSERQHRDEASSVRPVRI